MNWFDDWIVFSDLDGTLLDHHSYSWEPAAIEVARLIEHDIPLILSSSKTFAEMRKLASEMGLRQPMIVENGAAVAWPDEGGYRIEEVGKPRSEVIGLAHSLRESEGYDFSGFADWQPADLRAHADLDEATATLALERHGTEPILWYDTEERLAAFSRTLGEDRIRTVRGGRFIHLMGEFDKSSSMSFVVAKLSADRGKPLKSIALGDSPNDAAMLEAANVAVQIRSAKSAKMNIQSDCLIEPEEPGPTGWARALQQWWDTEGAMNT